MTEQSRYYLESYVPSWLAHDKGYCTALKDRLQALMEMQDYNVDYVSEVFESQANDCPPAPGMCLLRVEATVREWDQDVEMDEDPGESVAECIVCSDAQQFMARQLSQQLVERSSSDG